MSTKKNTHSEDEFFAREEKARRDKAEIHQKQDDKKALQELHYMKCPKCGAGLETRVFREVEIDVCGECNGIWLDAGELETLAGEESHTFADFFNFFRSAK